MPEHLYRIDKFRVPSTARDAFLETIRSIELFLRTLPGCLKAITYEQTSGPGVFNIVTIAEWESAESMEGAKQAAAARYKTTGFNPAEFMAGLGVEADMAVYVEKPSEA
jgi:quinol monooxygenase YgiN